MTTTATDKPKTTTAKPKTHYFVINQLGQSAHRQGAFESPEAAAEWIKTYYAHYPAWIVAATPVTPHCKPLNKDGEPVREG